MSSMFLPAAFRRFILRTGVCLALSLPVVVQAAADYAQRDDVRAFIDEMVDEHDFDRQALTRQFARARRLDNVLEAISRPAEKTLTWKQYRPIFLKSSRIEKGRRFMKTHRALLQRAEAEYGVPAQIITAIIGVETFYGKHTGRYTIFDSLTTLGFDYPPRATFFRNELKALLLLAKEEQLTIDEMTGSYAGAMGMPQFISSSYRAYAVDFDGDGRRDLWHSMADVIGSVANYFHRHGWRRGEGIAHRVTLGEASAVPDKNRLKPYTTVAELRRQGVRIPPSLAADTPVTLLRLQGRKGDEYWLGEQNFYVISRYNHSVLYAMAVFQLSQAIGAQAD